MDYKEADTIIQGYVNYFNFMLRTNIEYYKNKRLREVEIRERGAKLIFFYLGDMNNGLKIRFYIINSLPLLIELQSSGFIKNPEDVVNIKIVDKEGLHLFFKCLEKVEYFKKK
jgi:hypothetical protein